MWSCGEQLNDVENNNIVYIYVSFFVNSLMLPMATALYIYVSFFVNSILLSMTTVLCIYVFFFVNSLRLSMTTVLCINVFFFANSLMLPRSTTLHMLPIQRQHHYVFMCSFFGTNWILTEVWRYRRTQW